MDIFSLVSLKADEIEVELKRFGRWAEKPLKMWEPLAQTRLALSNSMKQYQEEHRKNFPLNQFRNENCPFGLRQWWRTGHGAHWRD